MDDDKVFKVIEHVATHGCLEEDDNSGDYAYIVKGYCHYCGFKYHNINNIPDEAPHHDGCVYIIALELYRNLLKEKE